MQKPQSYCTHCGAELKPNARFCAKCGAPISTVTNQENPTPAESETVQSQSAAPEERKTSDVQREPKQVPMQPDRRFSLQKGLLIGCIAVIAILVVIIAVLVGRQADKDVDAASPSSNPVEQVETETPTEQTPAENLSLQLTQVNTHNYPEVQLYFQLRDLSGNLISKVNNPVLQITEQNAAAQEVVPQTLQSMEKNICFVMDISGSMANENKYIYGRDAILQLLDQMGQSPNYQAALLSFNDTQNTLEDFTTDYTGLRTELNAIMPDGDTAFWDSLEYALLRTNSQNGQKCIVAATDGMDNASRTTQDNVIALSKELQIPIYIITFDNSLTAELSELALATGGECFAVDNLQNIGDIYNSILSMQNSQFMVTFTSDGNTTESERSLALHFTGDGYKADTEETYHRVEEIYADQISNAIISSVSASSHLEEYYESTGHLYHVPENTIDGSYRTAWVENADGDGIGEWIKLSFDRTYTINGIEISNGYKKSADLYAKNNRPRQVRLHFSDGSYQDYDLTDTFEGAQRLTFPEPVTTNSIMIELLSVYPGTKYQDTCITELQVF